MSSHKKPTNEELDAQIQADIEEAEKLQATVTPEEESIEPEAEEPIKETPKEEPEPEKELQADPSEEAKDKLKKKLSASARENQKIYAKNRVINQALIEADDIPDPTDEDMVKEFPTWEEMSETEKRLAKETVVSKKWRETISKAKEQATKIEKWNDSVDEFVDDPKTFIDNPELEGKTDAFVEFAKTEENNSVPFGILVSAFLHEQSKGRVHHKGAMFETGTGGPNDKPSAKGGKLKLEESRVLRETNYAKWKEMLMAGKLEDDL